MLLFISLSECINTYIKYEEVNMSDYDKTKKMLLPRTTRHNILSVVVDMMVENVMIL